MKNMYLKHHGILGQKWGVRRYQNSDGTLTEAGRKQYRYNKTIRNAKKSGAAKTENLEQYNVGLTQFMNSGKSWVSGLINPHDFDWQERFNSKPVTDSIESFKESDSWRNSYTPNRSFSDTVIKSMNPGYGSAGTIQNCSKVSSAMELVLRGYTVCGGRQTFPSTSDSDELWWKGAKPVEYTYENCEHSLKSYGPGTSGTISIQYGNGTGHKMHWTNSTDNKFTIEDGQNGRKFSSVTDMCNEYGADKSLGFRTYRLDNCEPNFEAMGQDSVIRIASGRENSRGLRTATDSKYANVYNKFENRYVDTW